MPSRRNARANNRPAPQQLSEQDIVDAALRLIRKNGADKLSMRTLAAQLGVTPMAIYYHVPSKQALLDLVIDSVLSNVPMPTPSPERWQAQMKALSVTAWHLINAYPDLSRIMISRPGNKSTRALARYSISILVAAGFEERDAALAIAAYHTYMLGAYVGWNMQLRTVERGRTRAADKRLSSDGGQGAEGVTRQLRELRVEDWLDYGLEVMLAGIAAQTRSRRGARKGLRAHD